MCELDALALTPLVLKKNPDIVGTIKKVNYQSSSNKNQHFLVSNILLFIVPFYDFSAGNTKLVIGLD